MIPLKLHIKNFLSYGSELQTIDFTPHHLICLSGKNGHGKSALLDAITWSIWGIARKTATSVKADQGLLRLGQQQMMVILDFALGEHTYRVRREFSFHYGKAQAHLDFGMIDPLTQKLIPLTDKTIRDTQEIIEETINIDFETFINSTFLKQGQSNEFSKKSAKERKDIFATILGLNQYDALKKKALEKIKTAQLREKTIESLQVKIALELEKKDALEKEIKDMEQAFAANAQQESELAHKKTDLELQSKTLNDQIQKKNQLLYQKELCEKTYDKECNELTLLRQQWRTIHAQKQTYTDTTSLYVQQDTLERKIKEHQQKLQKCLELKETALKHKEALQQRTAIIQHTHALEQMHIRVHHEQQQQTLNNSIKMQQETHSAQKELSAQIDNLAKQKKELVEKTAALPTLMTTYAQADLAFEKRKAFYQKYSAHGNMLHQKIKSLQQKQILVKDGTDAACPLCEQMLSASRRQFLHQQLNTEYALSNHQYQRIARVISSLKPLLITDNTVLMQQKKEIDTLNFQILEQETIQKQIITLTQQHQIVIVKEQELQLTVKLLEQKIKEHQQNSIVTDLATIIAKDAECQGLKLLLADLEKEEKSTQYCKQTHENDQRLLNEIYLALKEYNSFQNELSRQAERKQQIITQCQLLKTIRSDIKTIIKELVPYAESSHIESQLSQEKKILENLFALIAQEKNTLTEQKGRLLNEQQKLTLLEEESRIYAKERQELIRLIDDYTIIAHATSKDGIQALLIEEAIPEVEHEANRLLARLTNNQAHISIESLRDLKKGGTKETLDIKISDATGSRAYELFSGGEAFRIDFAIRIALSKLLARRAGTALQTLIIDEGFGSQDDEGLANIMDSLYKIQDDFAKIIIVSHLDALKEQSPVHFVVHKSAQGSSVSVIEHG